MDISSLNCPQFVVFDSDAFQKQIHDYSVMSDDSLSLTVQSEEGSETLLPMQDDNSQLSSSLQSGYLEESTIDTTTQESYVMDDIDEKENFTINHHKVVPIKSKPSIAPKATIPKPFHFQTDSRVKSKHIDPSTEYEQKDFTSELRKNIPLQANKPRRTKVQPFHLTEAKKRKYEPDYVPLAEQISAFQRKTPKRYHTSSKKNFQPPEHWEPPSHAAKSPKLQAMKRRRVVTALSKEEQEQKEIDEMKAYEFHAKPVDPKIYKQPTICNVQPKIITKPKIIPAHLTRKAEMQHRRKKSEKKFRFKARPVPKDMLNGPTGLKEKPVIHITAPQAPVFQTEDRIEKRKLLEKKMEEKEAKKKQEAPKPKPAPIPCEPYVKKSTKIQPFSFDKMDEQRFLQKEKKIQEEIEREKQGKTFHAQMMPVATQPALPPVLKKPATIPQPFNFATESRNAKHQDYSDSSELRMSFRAHPAAVLKKEPFVPEKPLKHTFEFKEFSLHTDKRASDRQHLKEIQDAEELEREQALQVQKALEEEQERIELVKHRRELVHKAQPIRQFKPLEIKPSSLPLTNPMSPDFEVDKRLQSRLQ